MAFDFTIPPAPQLSDTWAYVGAASAVIVGSALVVWGRLIGRPLLTLGAGVLGFLAGGPAAGSLGLAPVVGQLVLTFAGLAGGFLLDRLVWALLAGVLVAGPVLTAMFLRPGAPASTAASPAPATQGATSPAADSLAAYAQSCWGWFGATLTALWDINSGTLLITTCAIGGFFVVLGLIRPRLIRIAMTSLVGALAVVSGLVVGVSQPLKWFWPQAWQHVYLPGAAVLALLILGVVLQYRAALQAERSGKDREAKPPEQSKGKPKSDNPNPADA
jgi:hypothetical protein